MKSLSRAVAGILMLWATGAEAQSADYPNRPITMVVANAAGSSTDSFARFFAQELSKIMKQPVVVENHAGGSGSLGAVEVLKRPADGYTIMWGNSATHGANFSLFKNLPYKVDDFAPVACVYYLPPVLAVREGIPAKTMEELITYAKENPGKLTYGWSSTTNRVGAELFKSRTGTDIRGVSYKSPPQVVNDMLGGRVDMVVEAGVTIFPHAKAGTMRMLALTSPTRLKALPDVPTLEEAGLKDAVMAPWSSIYAKAGTPKDVIEKLNRAFGSVIASPEYALMETTALSQSFFCSPEELGKFTVAEIQKWKELVTLAGIEKQ